MKLSLFVCLAGVFPWRFQPFSNKQTCFTYEIKWPRNLNVFNELMAASFNIFLFPNVKFVEYNFFFTLAKICTVHLIRCNTKSQLHTCSCAGCWTKALAPLHFFSQQSCCLSPAASGQSLPQSCLPALHPPPYFTVSHGAATVFLVFASLSALPSSHTFRSLEPSSVNQLYGPCGTQ